MNLVSRLAVYEKGESEMSVAHQSRSEMRKTLDSKLKSAEGEEDTRSDQRKVGRGGTKTA